MIEHASVKKQIQLLDESAVVCEQDERATGVNAGAGK